MGRTNVRIERSRRISMAVRFTELERVYAVYKKTHVERVKVELDADITVCASRQAQRVGEQDP